MRQSFTVAPRTTTITVSIDDNGVPCWTGQAQGKEATLLAGLTFTSDPPPVTFSIDDSGTISRNGRQIDEMSREELLETLRATLAALGLRKADNA